MRAPTKAMQFIEAQAQSIHLDTKEIYSKTKALLQLYQSVVWSVQNRADNLRREITRIRDGRMAIKNVEADRDGFKDLPLESEWLTSFKKHPAITELDRMLLAELVRMIEVHEDKRITVHFKFDDQIRRVVDYLEQRSLYPTGKEDADHGTKKPPAGATALPAAICS